MAAPTAGSLCRKRGREAVGEPGQPAAASAASSGASSSTESSSDEDGCRPPTSRRRFRPEPLPTPAADTPALADAPLTPASGAMVVYIPRPPTLIDMVAQFIKRAVLSPFQPSSWQWLLRSLGGSRSTALATTARPPESPLGLTGSAGLLLPPPPSFEDRPVEGDDATFAARGEGRRAGRKREREACPTGDVVQMIHSAPRGESSFTRQRPLRGDDGELSCIIRPS